MSFKGTEKLPFLLFQTLLWICVVTIKKQNSCEFIKILYILLSLFVNDDFTTVTSLVIAAVNPKEWFSCQFNQIGRHEEIHK